MQIEISQMGQSRVPFSELRDGDLFERPGFGAAIRGFEVKRGKTLVFGVELTGGFKFDITPDTLVFRLKVVRVIVEKVYNEAAE